MSKRKKKKEPTISDFLKIQIKAILVKEEAYILHELLKNHLKFKSSFSLVQTDDPTKYILNISADDYQAEELLVLKENGCLSNWNLDIQISY